jgi:replicative DNA helicase
MKRLEQTILKTLIFDDNYLRKVIPFIRPEYFTDKTEQILFNEITAFTTIYNSAPSIEAINISIKEKNNLTDDDLNKLESYVTEIENNKETSSEIQWLIDKTEKFCQERAIYNAVLSSISILDGKDKTNEKGQIPKILSDALAISFDTSVGHDYFQDSEERYEFYHKKEERIPFDLEYLNKITKGGVPRKTLNIILAGPYTGKSLFMCHMAANAMTLGKNVLYITMEMAEERIAERIDANLLNVTLEELMELTKSMYDKKVNRVKEKTIGKLIIKEYPTASASTMHFKTLLNELNLKKNFIPDVIFIDYLNICCSSRIKLGASVNTYSYVKSIAEEVRGLAIEFNVPIWSATQTTRSGSNSSDLDMTDISESFGVAATCDFMIGLINSEELEQLGQIMVKQLKNRYADPTHYKRFTVGVDRAKMKLYDIEQSGQSGIVDAGQPVKPQTPLTNKFEGFKI